MPDLFLAVGNDDPAAVRAALATGVSVDARNVLGFTPLMFAAALDHSSAADALLKSAANVNAESPYGSPLTLAEAEGHERFARLLLDHGAAAEPKRVDQITPLMLACYHGHTGMVSSLLEGGAKVESRNNAGATALTYAARTGQVEAARLLLAHGAAVDTADACGWTPLMHAAANGHPEMEGLLLEKGARADARDAEGRTALLLAVGYSGDAQVIRLLLEHGADAGATDRHGRTPAMMAAMRGNQEAASLLQAHGAAAPASISGRPATTRTAAEAGLARIQHAAGVFQKKLGCASCHHQGLELMTTGLARDYGFAVDAALNRSVVERIRGENNDAKSLYEQVVVHPELAKQVPFAEIGEAVTMGSFLMAGLAAQRPAANPLDATVAILLARRQSADGRWRFDLQRVPMQSSDFTTTAYAIRAVKTFAARKYPDEVRTRIAKAKRWLLTANGTCTEDRALRLLGLVWAGASPGEMRSGIEELRGEQHPDGGWSQLGPMRSDAYATGEALVALRLAGGLPGTDPTFTRGVDFLRRTQDDDGSWYVHKRAAPLNFYTDVEFPHGESQYSSFNGTCWATMALVLGSASPKD